MLGDLVQVAKAHVSYSVGTVVAREMLWRAMVDGVGRVDV